MKIKKIISGLVVLLCCFFINTNVYAQFPMPNETKKTVTMKEFDKGYELFNWLHFNFNVPNAYKDIKENGK